MIKSYRCLSVLALFFAAALLLAASGGTRAGDEPASAPEIPRTWDEEALAAFEVPLAHAGAAPIVHVSAQQYYQLPVRKIYRSYPVYHPSQEPPGYLGKLAELEPEIAFDETRLATEADWIAAGRIVFYAPTQYNRLAKVENLRDPEWYEKTGVPVSGEGIVPFFQYVVREKGQVEVAEVSCATCHVRVMDDGTLIEGAQGNFPMSRLISQLTLAAVPFIRDMERATQGSRASNRQQFGIPWAEKDPMARIDTMSFEDIARAYGAIPPGVVPRAGSSLFYPPQVPDLIGVKDRRYLNRTADKRHGGIGDMMRFAAMVSGMGMFTRYGDRAVASLEEREGTERFSDAQLYALARYLYSLEPPPNPHPFDELARRGEQIFTREGCRRCHTPPLYTSNKLVAVDGFEVSPRSPLWEDVLPVKIGTDPNLALTTLRGTGLYKVPSLKGVWYRGPLEHNGSVATLEDWFDRRRWEDDYVPTGLVGYGVDKRPVRGHKFGLDLPEEERRALIAFLRTL